MPEEVPILPRVPQDRRGLVMDRVAEAVAVDIVLGRLLPVLLAGLENPVMF